jgi:hypothetical protein
MIIDKITFTSADDYVTIDDMFNISSLYPCVEWGILLSKEKQGTLKYPSNAWLKYLEKNVNQELK